MLATRAQVQHVRPEPPRGSIVWARCIELGNLPHDGKDRTGAAGGRRRSEGGERQIGEGNRVPQAERAMPEQTNQVQRDTSAKSGLRISQRKHVAGENQPHRRVTESAQSPLRRLCGRVANQTQGGGRDDTAHADDRRWDRFGDEPDNHRGKERKVSPGVRWQAGGHRREKNRGTDDEWNGDLQQRRVRLSFAPSRRYLRWARTFGYRHRAGA